MKKLLAGLMIAAAMFSFGCGRNAEFGTVDMSKLEAEAPIVKTTQEDLTKKMNDLKVQMDKDMAKVLFSQEELQTRIRELGAQLSEDYRGKCPILVGVLKGVVPFFAEMANAISIPVQEDFMCITSFEGGTESTGKLTFRKDIDHDIEGRHVLILEDIIDSGSTLKMICEMFRERKPASVKICTLLDKPTGRKVELKPDYTCFTIPAAFVVGFGLDYEDYYRNLPFVGVLKPSVYQDQ